MGTSFAKRVYDVLPIVVQNALCGLKGHHILRTRYNSEFHELLDWLRETEWWSFYRLRAYQNEHLRRLIRHAYETVPFYRRVMQARGLTPEDVATVEDLPKLPIVDKETVRAAGKDMLSTAVRRWDSVPAHTGGTTGAGLRFRVSRLAEHLAWAVIWRTRCRFGVKLGDRQGVFGGKDVVPLSQKQPPFWRFARPLNLTYFSIYHLKDEWLQAYVEQVERGQYELMTGYTSGLYVVADYLKRTGQRLHAAPRLVNPGSETLFPFQVEVFKERFGGSVASLYAQGEGCAFMGTCEHGNYHEDMELGVVEGIEVERLPEGRRCRIVGTALHNYAMPFIRYDTGDLATFSDERCACGREAPVAKHIDGRVESYIITPDGRKIGELPFFQDMVNVVECQIVQDELSVVDVNIVKSPEYGETDEKGIQDVLRAHVGPEMEIRIHYVDRVPRSKSGKIRLQVSRIEKRYLPGVDRIAPYMAEDPGKQA